MQWTEEFRGIAAGMGDVWLEKVKFQTNRSVRLDDLLGGDTPIAGLLQSIQQLELDDHTLMGLVPELSVLKSKLPAELNSGETSLLDSSPDRIAALRSQVQELLIAMLLEHGGTR